MSWYGRFRPYVSVAQRRAKADREIASRRKKGQVVSPVVLEGRTIAKTFWGKSWCDNLESYHDFANRLPRGQRYVRNGSVVDLQIKEGSIAALVSGSELYEVKIKIESVRSPLWKSIKKACSGRIASLVELLQGKLSKGVMDVVAGRSGLFPDPKEIKMSCSCPDWAVMCKHVAAVLYGVGARLDQSPELLFQLRGVDHLELIQESAATAMTHLPDGGESKTLHDDELADVFGIELADTSVSPIAPPPASGKKSPSTSAKPRAPRKLATIKRTTKAQSASSTRSRRARSKSTARKAAIAKGGKSSKRRVARTKGQAV